MAAALLAVFAMFDGYYVWNDPDRPLTVQFSLKVIGKLELNALEGFKSVPRRGLEVGGLLLGRSERSEDRPVVSIENFEPVISEHRSGPSYQLSEIDREHFAEVLREHPDAVGMYRTQTREESLELQLDDGALFGHYFTSPDALFLLIHPASGQAALFRAAGDEVERLHEFPFHARDLPVTEIESPSVPPPVAEPPAPAAEVVPVPLPASPRPSIKVDQPPPPTRRQVQWPVAALALLGGLAAGAGLFRYFHPLSAPAAAAPAPVPVAATPKPDHVMLEVQPDGTALRLSWDRRSPALRTADRATLEIRDGAHHSQLDLGPQELNSGAVSYWPESKDVSFRLRVFGPNGPTDDSIRAVGSMVAALPSAQPAPPVRKSKHAPLVAAAPPSEKTAPPPPVRGDAARAVEPEARPSPFVPPANPSAEAAHPAAPPASPVASPEPVPSIPRDREPNISVESEPVSGSKIGKVVSRIPLLKRLNKPAQTFVPPAPLREVKPKLSARERVEITEPVQVNVRVYVGEDGKVRYAELLTSPKRLRELTTATVYASRRWDFVPARLGTEHVAGEVILHFRFTPAGTPPASLHSRN